MTAQTNTNRLGRRRALTGVVAVSAVALGLLMGSGLGTASADVLDDIGAKYMQGAGGGQISNFAKESLQLRALGFRPSRANLAALQAGWDYLPNQIKLVDALKDTVTYQRRLQSRAANAQAPSGGFNLGGTQMPPGMPPAMAPGLAPGPANTAPGGIGLLLP